jgi:23S rRNA (guanosine2251-2'-O)-methyltransferase
MPLILGINPLLEALNAGKAIEKIYLLSSKEGPVFSRIYHLAKEQNIPVVQADRQKMSRLSGGKKHQGVVALLSVVDYVPLENLVENVQKQAADANFLIVDQMNDPQNFGAIIRSAEILGINGIIFSLKESVPVTDLVIKASAGAIFHISLCKVTNLNSAIQYLRDCGIWIYASSAQAQKTLWEMDFTRPQAIVIGSEGRGIRPLLLKNSDEVFRIPQKGKTESLNASVAAGIIMAEIFKQRQHEPGRPVWRA